MGIEKVELYICTCDNCRCDYEYCDFYMVYPDESEADNACRNDGAWIKEGDNYYCSECYKYDEGDKLILSEERRNFKK